MFSELISLMSTPDAFEATWRDGEISIKAREARACSEAEKTAVAQPLSHRNEGRAAGQMTRDRAGAYVEGR